MISQVSDLYKSKLWCFLSSSPNPDKNFVSMSLLISITFKLGNTSLLSKRQENFGIPTLKDNNGTYNSYESGADILNNYFSTEFTKESTDNLPNLDSSHYPSIDPLIVTVNGIASLLCGLNVHKTCGPDGIYPRPLKETAHNVAPMLTILYIPSFLETAQSSFRLEKGAGCSGL